MKKLSTLLLLLLLVLVVPMSAHAAINVPDSGPFITRVDIYRHALEIDDMLVVARSNIPYVNVPTETISQAFTGRLLDGSTELARVSPYSYYNSGYDYGMFSMCLDAASAPT